MEVIATKDLQESINTISSLINEYEKIHNSIKGETTQRSLLSIRIKALKISLSLLGKAFNESSNNVDGTIEKLLERVEELELLNRQLMLEKEQEAKLEYAWSGNLGHWYWNIKTNSVKFNPLKVTALGYDMSEIPNHVTYQFFTDLLHPEDYEKTMKTMLNHLHGEASVYEVEYRIKTKDGNYKWYYDRGKITQYDNDGKPLFLSGIVFDITDKKKAQLELEYKNKILAEMSSIDDLTKINNHRALIGYLQVKTEEAKTNKTPLTVGIFDLDNFKGVNDNYGHVLGDKVLMEVATILKNSIRDTDFVGRYGGEEFMVVFPNTNLENALKIAEVIRKTTEYHPFVEGIKITISGGLKEYDKEEKLTDLIHAADISLYKAKNNGKNQILVYRK